jgi:hypothetical protein
MTKSKETSKSIIFYFRSPICPYFALITYPQLGGRQSNIIIKFNNFSDTVYTTFMYFEPLATEKAIATYHVMLFGCRTGGDEGDLHLGLASSVKESYIHLLEHRLKADVLCINSSNGTFINDGHLSTESAPYELKIRQ